MHSKSAAWWCRGASAGYAVYCRGFLDAGGLHGVRDHFVDSAAVMGQTEPGVSPSSCNNNIGTSLWRSLQADQALEGSWDLMHTTATDPAPLLCLISLISSPVHPLPAPFSFLLNCSSKPPSLCQLQSSCWCTWPCIAKKCFMRFCSSICQWSTFCWCRFSTGLGCRPLLILAPKSGSCLWPSLHIQREETNCDLSLHLNLAKYHFCNQFVEKSRHHITISI